MRYGSDVVVDLLLEAGVEYVAFNPGATFRGIHDSLVHKDQGPKIVLCPHEGIAVAVAHGYAKAAGRPMAVLLHDVVGLQNASMAIYNAWCDRVPILLIGGTGPMSKPARRPWIDWIHTALVQGQQVRDYVKWDDQPADLESLPESFSRAWTTMLAAPTGPVYLCVDAGIQEQEVPDGFRWEPVRNYAVPTPPSPAQEDVLAIGTALSRARLPVVVTDYAGSTRTGFASLVQLAERLASPVVDCGRRLSFPSGHDLSFGEEMIEEADVILALDVEDPAGVLGRAAPDARVFTVSPAHLKLRSWQHDYGQLRPAERHVTATCDTALPALLAACVADDESRDESRADRAAQLARRAAAMRKGWRWEARGSPDGGAVAPRALAALLGNAIADTGWTLVHGSLAGWERRLWRFERFGQHLGWHGGAGLGYGLGASVGATIGLDGRELAVNVQPDGDLLYTPAALWVAARYRTPLLTVMHNNRQYENTVEHAIRIGHARRSSDEGRHQGAALDDPVIDFASLARSFGVWATGPVTRAEAVPEALDRALAVVREGAPALVDVVTAGH
jgi:thiamine pyrophosphate-dependent acetolactate synthase large subunit-like protein